MKRAFLLLAAGALACRPSAPAPDPVPPAVAFAGPALELSRTTAGLQLGWVNGDTGGSFAFKLVLPGGTLAEDPLESGVTALLAGTLRRASSLVHASGDPALEDLAGREGVAAALGTLGVELTAAEEPEALVLQVDGPAHQAAVALAMTCALAFAPRLDQDAVEDARAEALQGLADRARGSPGLAEEVLRAVVYPGHPLGRPAWPSGQALEALPLTAVAAWHARLAQPARSLLLGTGVARQELTAALGRCVATVPDLPAPLPVPPAVPSQGGGRVRRVAVPTPEGPNAYVRLGGPAPLPGTPEAAALGVAMEAVSNAFSSTLVRELRTRRGLVYGVEGVVHGVSSGGWWSVGTSTSVPHAAEVARVMVDALAALHREGVPAARWRTLARASALGFALGREVPGELLNVELDGWLLHQPPGAGWRQPAWLWNLDPAWAGKAVRPWLDPALAVLVVVGPPAALGDGPWDAVLPSLRWPDP